MLNVLEQLKQKVKQNKARNENNCENCPLQDNCAGPLFIDHEGSEKPEIVIISESPAQFEKVDCNYQRVEEWKEEILEDIISYNCPKEPEFNTLPNYLAALTENRLVADPKGLSTINKIYWTHALKCFIQKEKESIKEAKQNMGNKFRDASTHCSGYLVEEIEYIKPQLTVIIGEVAYSSLFPRMKEIIGKPLSIPSKEYILNYHPNAPITHKLKMKGFSCAKKRINDLL